VTLDFTNAGIGEKSASVEASSGTTVTFHLSAKPKAGGAMAIDCRHTAIWEKRGGKRLIVHEHLSAPLPG
jgi:ketosteroid isomerase-like protein